MQAPRSDPCVMFKTTKGKLVGKTVLKAKDSYGIGTKNFISAEETESQRFHCRPRIILQPGDKLSFNGMSVSLLKGSVFRLDQSEKLQKTKVPKTTKELVSIRPQAQYIGCCVRPNLCASVQLLASKASDPTPQPIQSLKKIAKRCHTTSDVELKYVSFDESTLFPVNFTCFFLQMPKICNQKLGF